MNIQRARQILQAEENFTVLYNGLPVWIENISSRDNAAMIRPMDGRGDVKKCRSLSWLMFENRT